MIFHSTGYLLCLQILELISRIHQHRPHFLLMSTMSDIIYYDVLDVLIPLSPQCLVQIPARLCWANGIVSTLNDDDRQMLDLVSFLDKLTISHPATIYKEVAFNSCEC